mgnify:FL=1|tara:strand:- start:1571 stop:1777 length:207 start_codon:yes stop_codon:yes gene_type:complete
MNKCIHCNKENKNNWFYCRSCGKKASESKFTTNMWMTSQMGKRTDVELSVQSISENTNKMRKNLGYGG